MTASSSKGGKAGGRNHRFPRGTCWNCGDKGHFKDKCPKPQKQKDRKEAKDSQKGGSANAAVGVDSDSEVRELLPLWPSRTMSRMTACPILRLCLTLILTTSLLVVLLLIVTGFRKQLLKGRWTSSEGSDWDPADLFEDSMPAVGVVLTIQMIKPWPRP